MSRKKTRQSGLVIEYMQTLRRMMRLSIDWTNTVAETLGVHPTDLMAGVHLLEVGPMTAGELATLAGLTTGAMTAAIDRLERGGFATREADPHDRRKVIIRPGKLSARLIALREEAMDKFRPVFFRYTDTELLRMIEFTRDITAILEREIPNFKKVLPKNKNRRAK
jgi:DNA-binding MarR family transcriptional regulator